MVKKYSKSFKTLCIILCVMLMILPNMTSLYSIKAETSNQLTAIKVVDITTGSYHKLMLDSNGRVWVMQSDKLGIYNSALGLGVARGVTSFNGVNLKRKPVMVTRTKDGSPLPKITKIDAGYGNSLLLDEDGVVWTAGRGDKYANGDNLWEDSAYFKKVDLGGKKAVDIASGEDCGMAVDEDGHIWFWGGSRWFSNGFGYDSSLTDIYGTSYTPTPIQLVTGTSNTGKNNDTANNIDISGIRFKEIAISDWHDTNGGTGIAWAENGELWTWGAGRWNAEKGDGVMLAAGGSYRPRKVAQLYSGLDLPDDIVKIDTGVGSFSFLTSSGELYTWGANAIPLDIIRGGALGHDITGIFGDPASCVKYPRKVENVRASGGILSAAPAFNDYAQFAFNLYAVDTSGSAYATGELLYSTDLGLRASKSVLTKGDLSIGPPMGKIIKTSGGHYGNVLFLDEYGNVWESGDNGTGPIPVDFPEAIHITVNLVDTDGRSIYDNAPDSFKAEYPDGAKIVEKGTNQLVEAPVIPGYELTSAQGSAFFANISESKTIEFRYEKVDFITINEIHITEGGGVILDKRSVVKRRSELPFTVDSKSFPGYVLSPLSEAQVTIQSADIPAGDTNYDVTFFYQRESVTVTVKYLLEDHSEVIPENTLSAEVGTVFTADSANPSIGSEFIFLHAVPNQSIVVSNDPDKNTITLFYRRTDALIDNIAYIYHELTEPAEKSRRLANEVFDALGSSFSYPADVTGAAIVAELENTGYIPTTPTTNLFDFELDSSPLEFTINYEAPLKSYRVDYVDTSAPAGEQSLPGSYDASGYIGDAIPEPEIKDYDNLVFIGFDDLGFGNLITKDTEGIRVLYKEEDFAHITVQFKDRATDTRIADDSTHKIYVDGTFQYRPSLILESGGSMYKIENDQAITHTVTGSEAGSTILYTVYYNKVETTFVRIKYVDQNHTILDDFIIENQLAGEEFTFTAAESFVYMGNEYELASTEQRKKSIILSDGADNEIVFLYENKGTETNETLPGIEGPDGNGGGSPEDGGHGGDGQSGGNGGGSGGGGSGGGSPDETENGSGESGNGGNNSGGGNESENGAEPPIISEPEEENVQPGEPNDITPLPPTVNPIAPSTPDITGKGDPGATITAKWPDGSASSTLVDQDGNWSIKNPGNLKTGEVVVFHQEKDAQTSESVEVIVADDPAKSGGYEEGQGIRKSNPKTGDSTNPAGFMVFLKRIMMLYSELT